MPETIKIFEKKRVGQCIRECDGIYIYISTCIISIIMLMILYEEYVKNLKKPGICQCIRAPPSGRHSTSSSFWTSFSASDRSTWRDDDRKLARNDIRWLEMARRWFMMRSSWPQVGSKWVIRPSWRWLSVDDVVQK